MTKVETYSVEYDRVILQTQLTNGTFLDILNEYLVCENFYYVIQCDSRSTLLLFEVFDNYTAMREYVEKEFNIELI